MKDVAAAAGISVATVSHVLNNTKYVTDDIRKRVLDAVQALNYKPNITARNFKMGKRQIIGFVVPDIANIFFSTLINEVEEVVDKADYLLLVVNSQENTEREKQQLHRLTSGLVDGLVIASTIRNYNDIRAIIPGYFPAVFLDRKPQNCTGDMIAISNYDAVYRGVENLIKRGHRRIGCITGSQNISTLNERIEAFRASMTNNGVTIDEELILAVDVTKKINAVQLDAYFSKKMTAVVFMNNTITLHAMGYMNDHNIVLNKDIAALGYSDPGWHEYAIKAIDVISQPIVEMGNMAGMRILERIADPSIVVENFVLQAAYIPRL
jgi:LacI family transcriptional regulator